jgi:outer membrane receptor protein involved in Fe transport
MIHAWLAGSAMLLVASAAQAQTTPPADQAPAPGDIIVTAQKRAQNLQNVPAAVQVVSGQLLQANGVRDFADLNRVAPSLVVRPAENPVNASVSIRGVGTLLSPSASSPASLWWSMTCRSPFRRAPLPILPISSGSRCCAAPRAPSTANPPRRA